MTDKELSIVIGSYNRKKFLISTIKSIRTNGIVGDYELIVVDGGSTDGSLQWLLKQKDIITIVQHNRGTFNGKPIIKRSWGYFMNLAFKAAMGKYILMLSDDCLVTPGSISRGTQHFNLLIDSGRKVGALAFYWRNWPEQEDFMVGLTFGRIFVNHGLYLRTALEEINFIDESYHFYHADGDLSLRLLQAGYEVLETPDSYVEHFTHANIQVRQSNLVKQHEDWDKYNLKWGGLENQAEPSGNKISKSYSDTTNTYLNFPALERRAISYNEMKLKLRGKLSSLFLKFFYKYK
jgi:glycosyltransferase involved in cell wall biosynthesis